MAEDTRLSPTKRRRLSGPANVAENIELLETLAEQILSAKKKVIPRRPIVIEFCGTPKAGKSSCISSLTIFLKRNGFNVHVLAERAGLCPIKNKYDPNFNIWTACSALIELSEILSNRPREFDIVILDRGFFDAACWFNWQHDHGKVDTYHYNLFVEFFFAPHWRNKIDLVYTFIADPDTALEREYANLLTRKRGSVMNDRVIHQYNSSVDHCISEYGSMFHRVVNIDTTGILQNEVSFNVTFGVLEALQDLVTERVGYVDISRLPVDLPEVFPLSDLLSHVDALQFGNRASVEADINAVQPIPIGMIADHRLTRVLVARKSRSGTSKTSSERNRDLFYFGGHVRPEDGDYGPDVEDMFEATLRRELKEELDLDFVPSARGAICIWDRNTRRSSRHMAVAMLCQTEFDVSDLRTDRKEFSEKALKAVSQAEFNVAKLRPERWSQVMIEKFLGWSLF